MTWRLTTLAAFAAALSCLAIALGVGVAMIGVELGLLP
jgi:hypothetical protein